MLSFEKRFNSDVNNRSSFLKMQQRRSGQGKNLLNCPSKPVIVQEIPYFPITEYQELNDSNITKLRECEPNPIQLDIKWRVIESILGEVLQIVVLKDQHKFLLFDEYGILPDDHEYYKHKYVRKIANKSKDIFETLKESRPELTAIAVNGHLTGGIYPHAYTKPEHYDDKYKINDPIQSRIFYSPLLEFIPTTIYMKYSNKVKLEPLMHDLSKAVLITTGFCYNAPVYEGTFDECLEFTKSNCLDESRANSLLTNIPKRCNLGLPVINGNLMKGLILEPEVALCYPKTGEPLAYELELTSTANRQLAKQSYFRYMNTTNDGKQLEDEDGVSRTMFTPMISGISGIPRDSDISNVTSVSGEMENNLSYIPKRYPLEIRLIIHKLLSFINDKFIDGVIRARVTPEVLYKFKVHPELYSENIIDLSKSIINEAYKVNRKLERSMKNNIGKSPNPEEYKKEIIDFMKLSIVTTYLNKYFKTNIDQV